MSFSPNAIGMNSSAPTGSVIMMFSMMRRMVTLHAEPVRNCTITKKNAPRPIGAGVSERHQIGPEETRRDPVM